MEPLEQYRDTVGYVQALTNLSLRTALISIEGRPSGTGVLVGEDLVLTAAHVIHARNWTPTASKSIATVFDLVEQPGRSQAETGIRIPVARIVAGSPPTESEVRATAGKDWNAPSENLDFALLQLAVPVPVPVAWEAVARTSSRGYYLLSTDIYRFEPASILMFAQYSLNGFLEFSFIRHSPQLNSAETRIRYRCNILPGSSGAPIVDTRGKLVAIHHYSTGEVNEGIPISAIARDLTSSPLADLFDKAAQRGTVSGDPRNLVPSGNKSVFVSYSHKEDRYRERLDVALAQLRRDARISIWHDGMILPGQEWDREIGKNLETANIVLLLVSPYFLASPYIYSREMLRALERHKSGSAIVVPIILKPCDWQETPLGELQALPDAGRPVLSWSNRDQAWHAVARGLRRLISS
jgi:hypothetical protein